MRASVRPVFSDGGSCHGLRRQGGPDHLAGAVTASPHFLLSGISSDAGSASCGYLSRAYAASLAEFGTPLELANSGGWLLARNIPGTNDRDVMGCYPLLACRDWSSLSADLEALRDGFVSVAAVADPFGPADRSVLEVCFDFVRPFKEHFIVDLERNPDSFLSRNHRYKALRSLRQAHVEICHEPSKHLDEWASMYDVLIARHGLRGVKAFSREAFSRQLQVPGLVMFQYLTDTTAIAAQLWYVQGETACNHLLAMHARGYETWAAYGLCYEALNYFRSGAAGLVRRINLGAGAGLGQADDDGLARFKRGWASETQPVYFCGRIFDQQRYADLTGQSGASASEYFPAYRQGEFA